MPETATTTLREVMSPDVPVVSQETKVSDAAVLMVERGVGALIVSNPDGTNGIISDRDMTRALAGDGADARVADHETHDVIQAAPDWPLQRAAETMARGGFRHLVVAEDGRVLGMVSIRDLLRALLWGPGLPEPEDVEVAETAAGESADPLRDIRRTAKQHLVAAACSCQLEWLEVLQGQLEARPDLSGDELGNLWASRAPCPRLMEPGGAD